MSVVATPSVSEATGLVAELYQEDLAEQGYVASHTAVMAVNATTGTPISVTPRSP